jgi:hypothetical protein
VVVCRRYYSTKWPLCANNGHPRKWAFELAPTDVCFALDTVAKVVLPKVLKILRAAGTFFAYGFEGPHRLTQNSWATSVARLTLSESSIALCFGAPPKIRTDATFDFCNTIPSTTEVERLRCYVRKVPAAQKRNTLEPMLTPSWHCSLAR